MRLGVSSGNSGLSGLSGLGIAFTPLNISGLLLWPKADVETFSDDAGTIPANNGDNIALWGDQSGNGNDAFQTVNAERPQLLSVEPHLVNGLPVTQYNGSSDFFEVSLDLALTTNSNLTMFVVMRPDDTGVNNTSVANLSVTNEGFLIRHNSAETLFFISINGGSVSLSASGADTDYVIATFQFDDGTMRLWRNGISEGGTIAQRDMTGHSTSTFIGTIGDTASQWYDGRIAEILIYNSVLNENQRDLVENYLNERYAIF